MIDHKPFADTGISIPEIGLGTYQFQGGPNPLRAGLDAGALFIDTAEAYGTEEIVGQAIRGLRHRVFVATKVSARNFRPSDLIRSADQSLRRLGTDYIDLYQLHWPNYTVPIADTMGAMETLVEKGMIRFIGVSNFSAGEMRRAQKTLTKNKIASNQVKFSLVERTIQDAVLQYCTENRITVIAFSPLAQGLHNTRQYDPDDVINEVAKATGKTPAQILLNWCLSHASVVVIPKANSIERTLENCGASGWRLTLEQFDRLSRRVRFKRRSPIERFARRTARRILQTFRRNLEVRSPQV